MRAIAQGLAAVAVVGGALALWKVAKPDPTSGAKMKTKTVHVVIDESVVAATTDAFSLIEPLWDRVDIYGSWTHYQITLRPFTVSQRHLFAIQWYRNEVNNGGHAQFFGN
jgi:hypothetical protein